MTVSGRALGLVFLFITATAWVRLQGSAKYLPVPDHIMNTSSAPLARLHQRQLARKHAGVRAGAALPQGALAESVRQACVPERGTCLGSSSSISKFNCACVCVGAGGRVLRHAAPGVAGYGPQHAGRCRLALFGPAALHCTARPISLSLHDGSMGMPWQPAAHGLQA